MQAQGLEPLLSVTRAWRLVKFVDNGMLTMTDLQQVRRPLRHAPARDRPPLRVRPVQPAARAGKGKLAVRCSSGAVVVTTIVKKFTPRASRCTLIEPSSAHPASSSRAWRPKENLS